MALSILDESAKQISRLNNIDFYKIQSNRFKTNIITVNIYDQLSNDRATLNALLPAVLSRGCELFNDTKSLFTELENLYGAVFDCGVKKKGDYQIIQFYIEFISDKYINEKNIVFKKVVDIFFSILLNPHISKNSFNDEYVRQEKLHLRNRINAKTNDKVMYAMERCFEGMCEDDPSSIYEKGDINRLDSINSSNLYNHYQYILKHFPMDVYLCGDFQDKQVNYIKEKFSKLDYRDNIIITPNKTLEKKDKKVKYADQIMNVEQAKLSLGFRTNTSLNNDNLYSHLLFNGILVGGGHSKLFKHVREERGLAYYISSKFDKFKGALVISCGIEKENKEETVNIILNQMEEIKKGNITDYEYESAKKYISNGVSYLKDHQSTMIEFSLSFILSGMEETFESFSEKINRVSKEDIMKIAELIELDTVYFLSKNSLS